MESLADPAVSLAKITRMAVAASDGGAQLALFPEAAVFPIYTAGEELTAFARSSEATAAALAEIALQTRMAIAVGTFEPSNVPGKVRNTVLVYGPDGKGLGAYRKIHLYDAFGTSESERFVAGPVDPFSFILDGFRFGLLTCYDLRFPELARALVAGKGCDALLVPAAWARGPLKEAHWTTLLRARAIENTAYVLAAGQCGSRCTGLSAIVDPLGVTLASLAEEEGVAFAGLRRQRIQDVRRQLPSVANQRMLGGSH